MPISVHNANFLRRAVETHRRKVQSLYKRAVRNLESWENFKRDVFLYERSLLRHRFEQNAGIKDLRKAKVLLMEGEKELYENLHPRPMQFPYSPGGICYERYSDYPDWHLDYWHPLEKAQYPYYFAKREAAKAEYVQMFQKNHGVNPEVDVGVSVVRDYITVPKTDEEKKYGPFLKGSKGAEDSGAVPPDVSQIATTVPRSKH